MIDLSEIPVIDFHAHIPNSNNITQVVDILFLRWLETCIDPKGYNKYKSLKSEIRHDLTHKEDKKISEELAYLSKKFGIDSLRLNFRGQLTSIPSFNYFLKYLSKIYECSPNIESIDKALEKELTSPQKYMLKILNREKINMVILDLFGKMDIGNLFPANKASWVYRIDKMTQLSWLRECEFTSLNQVIDGIKEHFNKARKKGCLGFKSAMTYRRNIEILNPKKDQVKRVFGSLLKNKPDNDKNIIRYQDFLLRQMLKEAGKCGLPFLFHLGVGGPGPRPDLRNIDPDGLRSILNDPALRDTNIVMLHCAYPFEKKAAVMAYQYSNLFVDLSIPTFFHGNLEQVLMTYLEFTPHQKLFYGSDAWHTPELFAYDLYYFKEKLQNALLTLSKNYGVVEEDCLNIATSILSNNAQTFLNL